MLKRSALLICLLTISVLACEVIVDVDLPDGPTPLVVNAFFSPDEPLEIKLSSALTFGTPVNSGAGDFQPVSNADFVLLEDDTIVPVTFTHENRGRFISSFLPKIDKKYALRVSSDGFESVEGISQLPQKPVLESIHYEQGTFEDTNGLDFRITLQDPGQNNFYGLYATSTLTSYDAETGAILNTSTFPRAISSRDPVLADQEFLETEETYFLERFFTDELFQGRAYELDFSITGFAVNFPDGNMRFETEIQLHFLSVSEELYRYKKSAEQQRNVGEDPFAEPVEVFSNMSNGVGIFAGFQSEIITLSPDSLINLDF